MKYNPVHSLVDTLDFCQYPGDLKQDARFHENNPDIPFLLIVRGTGTSLLPLPEIRSGDTVDLFDLCDRSRNLLNDRSEIRVISIFDGRTLERYTTEEAHKIIDKYEKTGKIMHLIPETPAPLNPFE